MAFWSKDVSASGGRVSSFQGVLQNLSVPAFVLNAEGVVVLWNDACADLTRLATKDVVGTKEHWRGFYPQPRACLADLVLQGGGDKIEELYDKRGDTPVKKNSLQAQKWFDLPGRPHRYILIDAIGISNASGQIDYVVETLQDLTALKEAEALIAAEHEEAARRRQYVMDAVSGGLAMLAQGNLLVRINDPFPPEIDQVRLDFNSTVTQLAKTMSMIGRNGSNVRNCSHELTQIMSDMLRGAAQMEQSVSATMEGMGNLNRLAKDASQGTDEASRVVASARKEAEQSGSVVKQAVSAMGEIEASSRQIGNIITVIDEIAFQTNLLALNAGVEAARAGDAGRGFAVVATEVRALAQRSADAAKEIKTLVSTSGAQVGSGVKLVGEAGAALTRIVAHVETLNGTITSISEAAKQQSSGLDNMSDAMNQMHKVQARTAELIDQTSQISQTLEAEASTLETQLLNFRLVEGAAVSSPSRSKVR